VPVDVVTTAPDEVGRELDGLAGDGEADGDGGGGGGAGFRVGGVEGGHDDARPPAVVVERLYDVVEVEARRGRRLRRGWRPGADLAERDNLREGAAAIVGDEVRVCGGVVADAAAIRGREVDDRSLVPGAVESFAVEANLDLRATGQGQVRRRRGLAQVLTGPATAMAAGGGGHWGAMRDFFLLLFFFGGGRGEAGHSGW